MHGRLLAAAAFLALAVPASASAVTFYGTDGSKLYTFDDAVAGALTPLDLTSGGAPITVLALEADPATGMLYGVNPTTLYEIDPGTGAARREETLNPPLAAANGYGAAFEGTDMLRVVGEDGTHAVINVASGDVAAKPGVHEAAVAVTGITDIASSHTYAGAPRGTLYAARPSASRLIMINRDTGEVGDVGSLPLVPPGTRYGLAVAGVDRGFLTYPRAPTPDALHPVTLADGTVGSFTDIGTTPTNLRAVTAKPFDVVNMTASTLTVDEGDPISLGVTRSGPLAGRVSVGWSASDNTTGDVTWIDTVGDAQPITIANAENTVDQPDRTVTVTLASTPGVVIPSGVTRVTIRDDDDPPVVQPPTPTPTRPPPTPTPTQTTPLTPPPTPPVNRAPRLTVPKLTSRRLRDLTTTRGLEVKVKSNEACRLTAELRITRPTAKALKIGQRIARVTAQLRANRQTSLRLRPVVQIRNKLRSRRTVSATVWLTCADNRGAAAPPKRVATTLRR